MRRALLALLLVASAAHADPPKGKNKNVAYALGGVGTGVSGGLLIASAVFASGSEDPVNMPLFISGLASSIVTPSLGQYYAGEYFTIGMGVRAAAGVTAYIGATQFRDVKSCGVQGGTCSELSQEAIVILGLASIAYIGGVAYDLYATGDVVDDWNRKHGIFVGFAMANDQAHTPLLGLTGRF